MIVGYAQNGFLDEALRLFKVMPQPDVVSRNAVIGGYAQNGLVEEALEIFKQMQLAGVKPTSATFGTIHPACAKMGTLEQGMEIHQKVIECRFSSNILAVTSLIDMYVKFGSIHKARDLFDKMQQRDMFSWNAMIAGYAQNNVLDEALRLFKEMPKHNVVSWNAIIAAYAQNGLVEKALDFFKQMHQTGVKPDWFTFVGILPSCAKIGALEQGYAQNGLVESALEFFKQMQQTNVRPYQFTFASILPACAKMRALEQGMEIHHRIIESGLLSDVLETALIDMYAKCGSIQRARDLFDKLHHPNVISWTAMIAGYAMHGYGKDALNFFELMKSSGTNPNHVSFVCILFACSHAGLADEGCKYFNCMCDSYSILPTMDHYACMVDLLGRAGYLEETLNLIIKMPIKPDVVVWMCLLGACRSHKNTELGEFVATLLFELDPANATPYVLQSKIYAEVGRWRDVQKVRKLMKDRGIKKKPGCSWIEVHKMVHAFSVGDKSHPQAQEIYAMLDKIVF
ncbi:hypothetical protein KI387_017969 [Taxus chinensis]|uniref:Chlororespiratory reduction 2 n=1 Tax=Taxus chinensis TaxID=29808 RepID=A0AA38LHY7_TAXCH|nr:hypothetical protein KI387_017969 [Taxus chinensis]